MGALATLVLVWVGAEQPEQRAKEALDGWAAPHGVRFEPLDAEPTVERTPPARELAAACEKLVADARDQLTAGDDEPARQTLARLEQTLRDHPELLQASWFMAERWRLEAQRARRAARGDRAQWDERADALEGARAAAFGDPPRTAGSNLAPIRVALAVHGARRHQVYWDGAPSPGALATWPGEHHLVVTRGGEVAWSGWVSVLASGTVDVWVPDARPCSAEDLSGISAAEDTPSIPPGVRCPAWGLASPGPERGTVRMALCRQDQCDSFVTAIYDREPATAPRVAVASSSGLPAWALWTLAGVGVAIATSVVLWRTGVFDRNEQPTTVVYDGSKL